MPGPKPIPVPMREGTWTVELTDLVIAEAFRQGWASARHWPNHKPPENVTVEMEEVQDEIILRVNW
jgi:hypothetical protein